MRTGPRVWAKRMWMGGSYVWIRSLTFHCGCVSSKLACPILPYIGRKAVSMAAWKTAGAEEELTGTGARRAQGSSNRGRGVARGGRLCMHGDVQATGATWFMVRVP